MSFFSDLFKRIPGGTSEGNALRNVANELSGGVFGNGAMIISQVDYDLQNLTDAEYTAKYGKTKTGVVVDGVVPDNTIMSVEQQLKTGVNKESAVKLTFLGFIKKNWFWLLLFPVTGTVFYLVNKNQKPKSKSKLYGR